MNRPLLADELIAGCGNSTPGLRAAPDAPPGSRADPREVEERTETMFRTIVWATDGSELADRALDYARALADAHGSRIVTVHANEVLQGRAQGYPALADEPELEEKIGKQVAELRSVGIDVTLEIRTGNHDVATLIRDAAEDVDADLIVVATHGHSGLKTALMGSVARALCHTAETPVLVIPPARRPERETAKDDRLAAV
jgi:nucleotide-binding universal stress UspA family protein